MNGQRFHQRKRIEMKTEQCERSLSKCMWRCGLLPSRHTIMNTSDAASTPAQAVSCSMEYN